MDENKTQKELCKDKPEPIPSSDGTSLESGAAPLAQKKCCGKGLLVAAIVFLVLGAATFAIYILSSASFFLTYFNKANTESAEGAIGAVFALLLSTPLVLLSAPPTILFLSLATAFLRKVRKSRDGKGVKISFALSAFLLSIAVLLTIAVAVIFFIN